MQDPGLLKSEETQDDKVSLQELLMSAKKEKMKHEAESFPSPFLQPRAGSGRPTPTFVADAKPDLGNDTIPWENQARRGGRVREGAAATASHRHHRQVVEVAHQLPPPSTHHHCPSSFAPPACSTASSCQTTASLPSSARTRVTFWCQDSADCYPGFGLEEDHDIGGDVPNMWMDDLGPVPASPSRSRVTRSALEKRYR